MQRKKCLQKYPLAFGLLVAVVISACGAKRPEPQIISSADSSAYAALYPQRLDSVVERFDARKGAAQVAIAAIPNYGNELGEIDRQTAKKVYEESKKAGQSRVYAEGAQATRAVEDFHDEEHDKITQNISGSLVAQAQKKETPCELEPYGTVSHSLKMSVQKRLEKRKEDQNPAHVTIEKNDGDLGKKNKELLKKQADEISEASYIVYVELPETLAVLEYMIEEKRDVRKRLKSDLEVYQLELRKSDLSKKEKKILEQSIADVQKASIRLDTAFDKAEKRYEKAIENQEIETMRKKLEDAVETLLDAVDEADPKPTSVSKAPSASRITTLENRYPPRFVTALGTPSAL